MTDHTAIRKQKRKRRKSLPSEKFRPVANESFGAF